MPRSGGALGCRQLLQVAGDFEIEFRVAPAAKRGRVGFEHLSQVAVDERTRLEALGQIPELLMEDAQARFQISKCGRRRRDVSEPFLDEPQVREQGCDVLHRPVVNVEAKANQTPLRDVEDLDTLRRH